jgi:tripartite-type tricarboxylate transporter receptor subunit TctC
MGPWIKPIAATLLAALASGAFAQAYPNKPIRVVVGYPPGTAPDLIARISGNEMGKRLGQPFIIENRPGAGGILGPAAVAKAEPDGYTLTLGGLVNLHPIFLKNNPLVMGKDLTPIGDVVATPWVLLARTSLGAKTYQDLVAHAKVNPGKLNFGSVATQIDIFSESLKQKTGLNFTPIRFKGAPVTELLNDQIDFYIGTITGLAPHIQSGKIVPLLFTVKHEAYPNVPSAIDLGVTKAEIRSNFGYYGTAGTPRDVIQRLSGALASATKTPEVIEQIRKLGLDIYYTTPEQQAREYEAQVAFFAEAAKAAKFEPQ